MSENMGLRLPPQNLEAEQCVLGSILLENNAIYEVIDIVDSDDFYREAHRKIFFAAKKIIEKNEPVDLITLQDELKRANNIDAIGGTAYLGEILAMVPTAANASYYAKIVKEKALERLLLNTCTSITNDIYNSGMPTETLLSEAEAKVFEVTGSKISHPYEHAKDVIKSTFRKIEELYERGEDIVGVPSGYTDLDDVTGGFRNGQLIIIAARPGMGKTALAMNFCRNCSLRNKKTVAVFSLEMSSEDVIGRLISCEARVDISNFMKGKIEENEWQNITRTAAQFSDSAIYIDDTSGISPGEIRAKCRRIKSQQGSLDLIIVDYLQLMRTGYNSKSQNREQEISEISRTLKEISKELEVPIIALSQLNREVDKRPNKRPWLSDLRESGAIEQDADIIMFIYRDDMYNPNSDWQGIAELILAKNRNGPTKTVNLRWFSKYTAFENFAKDDVFEIPDSDY